MATGVCPGDKPATQLVLEPGVELLEDPIQRLLKQHLPHGHVNTARQSVSRAASATAAWPGSAPRDVVGWRALLIGEQALMAFGASTCLLVERPSSGS